MSAENEIHQLKLRIEAIEKRNQRVEADKVWSDSWFRKILIAIFTYLSLALYFQYILQADPWLNAIVPTVGFLLSTLTLSSFKKLWLKHFFKKVN